MQLVPRLTKRAENLSNKVTAIAHTFTVGQLVYLDALDIWQLAQADDEATFKDGIISQVIDVDTFVVVYSGIVEWTAHGYTIGDIHYLSDTAPGGNQTTIPANAQIAFDVMDID